MHMRSTLVLSVVLGSACNGDERDSRAISGSAGLSTGDPSSSSGDPSADSENPDSTSGASGTTGNDAPGSSSSLTDTAGDTMDEDTTTTGTGDDGSTGGPDETTSGGESSSGGESDSSGIVDGVLDIGIIAHNDCTFTVTPSSITVPEGTEFTVNWVSSAASEVEFDIAKIDPFNHVPIVIGMEPGTSYHDDIRQWCGLLFTGTFDFRLTSCHEPLYIPVDCGG